MTEKYILTTAMHLGHCKDTFGRGSVIEFLPDRNLLIINGRKFDDTRDIDVLKRRSMTRPDRPWIIPYSPEALAAINGVPAPRVSSPVKPRPGEGMEIISSDEDQHEDIDISDTQVSKRNAEAKVASRESAKNREKDRKMEIIKGDESVEDRIARLRGKNDINSLAERVSLKRERAKMQIVEDDGSHGVGVSKSEIPRNAGQHLPSREEAEARRADAEAKAAAYKAEAERNRNKLTVRIDDEDGVPSELAAIGAQTPIEAAREMTKATTAPASTGEVENLRAQNAALTGMIEQMQSRMAAIEAGSQKRAPGRPKGAKDTKPRKVAAKR